MSRRHRDADLGALPQRKKIEKVDDRDSEELLQEYRRRFGALEGQAGAGDWKLWRGSLKDEPK